MIKIENIRITKDKHLIGTIISDVENVYITDISITTQDYYDKSNEFKIPIHITPEECCTHYELNIDLVTEPMVKSVPNPDYVEGSEQSESLIESKYVDLNTDLMFITVETTPTAQNEIVDCCHKKEALAVTYYPYCIFAKSINYLKEFSNNCEEPKGFMDFILKKEALDMAIEMLDVPQIKKWWSKFFNKNITVQTKGCGCHGR